MQISLIPSAISVCLRGNLLALFHFWMIYNGHNWKFLERKRALNCDCKLLVQNINTMGTFLA